MSLQGAYTRGIHKGYKDNVYLIIAGSSFESLVKTIVTTDEDRLLTMHNIYCGCGFGGNPCRDGSCEYFINEKHVDNDPKGVAPFILAASGLGR